jgi:hypothetical protein
MVVTISSVDVPAPMFAALSEKRAPSRNVTSSSMRPYSLAVFSANNANSAPGCSVISARRTSTSSPFGSQICCSFCCAAISIRSGDVSDVHTDARASMSA